MFPTEEDNERVKAMAAGLAQELGTPLSVMLARANAIARREVVGRDVERAASEIAEQVERVTRLVRKLLDYTRDEEPRLVLIDAAGLVSQVMDALDELASRHQVRLVRPQSGMLVAADVAGLWVALTEILINAIEAHPNGGTVRVELSARQRDGERIVCIDIDDEGRGISSAVGLRMFEPFFTTKDTGSGGMGLSVAAMIAKRHRGWIEGRNDRHGSTFTMCLPAE
jgi:signal transduction histidine kinase